MGKWNAVSASQVISAQESFGQDGRDLQDESAGVKFERLPALRDASRLTGFAGPISSKRSKARSWR